MRCRIFHGKDLADLEKKINGWLENLTGKIVVKFVTQSSDTISGSRTVDIWRTIVIWFERVE